MGRCFAPAGHDIARAFIYARVGGKLLSRVDVWIGVICVICVLFSFLATESVRIREVYGKSDFFSYTF
jgi:hypothetical protein